MTTLKTSAEVAIWALLAILVYSTCCKIVYVGNYHKTQNVHFDKIPHILDIKHCMFTLSPLMGPEFASTLPIISNMLMSFVDIAVKLSAETVILVALSILCALGYCQYLTLMTF